MSTDERGLGLRIRKARGLMRELLDLAELQGWTLRAKDDGFLFIPPASSARPGFEHVFARDPGTCAYTQRQIRDRFRKAGMKFPEDNKPQRERAPTMTARPQTTIAAAIKPAEQNAFERVRLKLNQTIVLLSDIEQELSTIEADSKKLDGLRLALKALGT